MLACIAGHSCSVEVILNYGAKVDAVSEVYIMG